MKDKKIATKTIQKYKKMNETVESYSYVISAGCDYPKLKTPEEGKPKHVYDPEPEITFVRDPPYSIGKLRLH